MVCAWLINFLDSGVNNELGAGDGQGIYWQLCKTRLALRGAARAYIIYENGQGRPLSRCL
jgi:hypothetical protein